MECSMEPGPAILVIPNEVLFDQLCTECYQYLSILPVTVTRKGEKICGRCLLSALTPEQAANLALSQYNQIAKHWSYKCVNHFDGCEVAGTPEKLAAHEKSCKAIVRDCFFCSYRGNLCQILYHSARFHPDNFTKDGSFQLPLDREEVSMQLIFSNEDTIYKANVDIVSDNLNIVVEKITRQSRTRNQFAVRFWSDHSETELTYFGTLNREFTIYFTKPLNVLQGRLGKEIIWCQIIVNHNMKLSEKELEIEKRYQYVLSCEKQISLKEEQLIAKRASFDDEIAKLRTALDNEKEDLDVERRDMVSVKNFFKSLSYDFFTCMSCKKYSTDECVFFCKRQHCYCSNCLKSNCIRCEGVTDFTRVTSFHKIVIQCDWPQCTSNVSFNNFINHKKNCLFRPYHCPLRGCSETLNHSNMLKEHWHSEIPKLYTGETIKFSKYDKYELFWLINKELYHILVDFFQYNVEIIIEEINVLPNNFKFAFRGFCSVSKRWETSLKFDNSCGKLKFCNKSSVSGYVYKEIEIYVCS